MINNYFTIRNMLFVKTYMLYIKLYKKKPSYGFGVEVEMEGKNSKKEEEMKNTLKIQYVHVM